MSVRVAGAFLPLGIESNGNQRAMVEHGQIGE